MVCDCGASSDSVFEESGELICTSCGKVLEENGLSSDAPTGSGYLQASQNETAQLRQHHNDWSKVEARVRDLASELKVSSHCVQVAQSLMRKALGTPRTGSVLERYAACCLLLATRCSPSSSVLTLAEVSERVRCDPHAVNRCWRELVMSVSLERAYTDTSARAEGDADAIGRGSGSSLGSIDLAALLERHCEVLRHWLSSSANTAETPAPHRPSGKHKPPFSQSCRHAAGLFAPAGSARQSARTLLWLAKREWLVEGRAPMQVSVAVVLLATQLHTHDEAAAALRALKVETLLGLGEQQQAVRTRLAELKRVLVAAVRALPGRCTLSEAAAMRVAPVALRQVEMQRAADDARAAVSARAHAQPGQGQETAGYRRGDRHQGQEHHPAHLPSQHQNQHQHPLQHEQQQQHSRQNEGQNQDVHRTTGHSSLCSCAADGESQLTSAHGQAPSQHRFMQGQEGHRQDKRRRREEGSQLDEQQMDSQQEKEQGTQQAQSRRHQQHRPHDAPDIQPPSFRATAVCEREVAARGCDPPAFSRAAKHRGRRALRLAAARERIARAPSRAESFSAQRTPSVQLADWEVVEPVRRPEAEGVCEAEDGAVNGTLGETLDGRMLGGENVGAGPRATPRMPERARAAAEPVADVAPPGASQGTAGAVRGMTAGTVQDWVACGAAGGTAAESADTLPATLCVGVLEREDVLIENALRRGVPEEAILQGFFSAATAREDRELRFEDAPRLFREELGEDDLPSEIVAQMHLRRNFYMSSGSSAAQQAGQEMASEGDVQSGHEHVSGLKRARAV